MSVTTPQAAILRQRAERVTLLFKKSVCIESLVMNNIVCGVGF